MNAETRNHVFAVPPGADYARVFAEGFLHCFAQQPPESRAQTTVFVNTGRARSLIEAALADLAPGPLPRLVLISDLATDPLIAPDRPPAIHPLRRQLRLTRLVEQFLSAKRRASEAVAPIGAAADLADALAFLIDQFHDSGVLPDRLDRVLAGSELLGESARHWQQTLAFVDIVRRTWPAIRDESENGRLDIRARQRIAIEALVAEWQTSPPDAPVLVAGSTGSVASTAMLMAAVARLPNGAVVLPGIDRDVDPTIWSSVSPDHPLGPFHGLMTELGLTPANLQAWHPTPAQPRRALWAQVLRPAPVTDHWHAAADDLRRILEPAMTGLGLLEAPGPRQEAEAIAVAVREALEEPATRIVIVTPDAALARRVSAALTRFGIVPDDTMGQPLAQSPPGILARLVVNLAADPSNTARLAALLQSPLVQPGIARRSHRAFARAYERDVLRNRQRVTTSEQFFPDWSDARADQVRWRANISQAILPLVDAFARPAALIDLVRKHRSAMERLTDAGDGDGPAVWKADAGDALASFFDQLLRNADALGDDPVADYPSLLSGLMREQQLRPKPREPHPRVALRGPREARIEDAEYTILAGLNDGVWPAPPDPGPWLSRPMHEELGLPLPERAVGLSAHDFLNAACRPRVLLTRSLRSEGAPTVASRWLIRLETLLKGIGTEDTWQRAKKHGDRLLAISERLATPTHDVPRAERPRPVPPSDALPTRLSVTDIETLVRDAYAVYARRILRLRPLDPVDRPADARDRGTILHMVLETFTHRVPDWPGEEAARQLLLETADDVLGHAVPWPHLRRTWRARIVRFADWFISEEARRRAGGVPLGVEIPGLMTLGLPGRQIEISAKADRIDRLSDGSATIYDYKTGNPPSNKQIEAGFNQQLHLQAAILADGGFCKLPALVASHGAYIGLTGRGKGGQLREIPLTPDEVIRHRAEVETLLARYDAGARWVSRGRAFREAWESDYDHLARRSEWEAEDES